MTVNDSPNSHIQLIVPEYYLQMGKPATSSVTAPFNGDVDSIENLTPDTKIISWGYADTTALPYFTLVYGHLGSLGVAESIQVKHGTSDVECVDAAQEVDGDWEVTSATSVLTRNTETLSNVLLEHENIVESKINTLDIVVAGGRLAQVMFSRDYTVPMYDRSWNCTRTFASSESESYLKQKYPRFHLRNEYREVAEHFFEWTGLTATEKRVFDIFFAAFAGNITQPFAMCIIHPPAGGSISSIVNTMTTRMLIIDSSSVNIGWKRSKEMQRDGLSFTALELIPN